MTVVGMMTRASTIQGATVELFSEFQSVIARFSKETGNGFSEHELRSTKQVLNLINSYATLDKEYQRVRVASKPKLKSGPVAKAGIPFLECFATMWIRLQMTGVVYPSCFLRYWIYLGERKPRSLHRSKASCRDCALLTSSPQEYTMGGDPRLPLLLRQGCQKGVHQLKSSIAGQDLAGIEIVARFGGLLLECLDPSGVVQDMIRIPGGVVDTLNECVGRRWSMLRMESHQRV